MTRINPVFRSDIDCYLLDSMGDENSIVRRARVSTGGPGSSVKNNPGDELTNADKGLIRMLFREKHGVPFEGVEFEFYLRVPVFVSRQIVKHRLCLSGATRVHRVFKDGTSYGNVNNTLEKMWELWHIGADRTHKSGKKFKALLPNRKDIWVRSYTEDDSMMSTTSKVVGVEKNGVMTTYLMTTEDGQSIRATKDHKFFTPDGWMTLGQLSVGDYLYREGKVAINTEKNVPPRLREGIGIWTQRMRDDLISHKGAECYLCGNHFEKADLELDHVVPVSQDLKLALDVDNLNPACEECHGNKSSEESSKAIRMGSRQSLVPSRIVSIGDEMEEETYDLVLEGPIHNFIANGLCTHNSSINEESGRYRELQGEFYVIPTDRKIEQIGKTGSYQFKESDSDLVAKLQEMQVKESTEAWTAYQDKLEMGVAKEVARQNLPVNIYSSMYYKTNLRSALNFLSLRKEWGEDSLYPSHPQYEITLVADKMAEEIQKVVPTVYETFLESGMRPV